ncbi:hypothetical protein DFH07DRAFT_778366 [Mycena maculata]|uniref:Uncharacterized protein n=1 Tax=Mycena maculata TaxID=230809 RepID=A0AAD7ID54_9AGAR|nr:hypothetical protein DFH07DRAFT_778366 [Mycena maculata]
MFGSAEHVAENEDLGFKKNWLENELEKHKFSKAEKFSLIESSNLGAAEAVVERSGLGNTFSHAERMQEPKVQLKVTLSGQLKISGRWRQLAAANCGSAAAATAAALPQLAAANCRQRPLIFSCPESVTFSCTFGSCLNNNFQLLFRLDPKQVFLATVLATLYHILSAWLKVLPKPLLSTTASAAPKLLLSRHVQLSRTFTFVRVHRGAPARGAFRLRDGRVGGGIKVGKLEIGADGSRGMDVTGPMSGPMWYKLFVVSWRTTMRIYHGRILPARRAAPRAARRARGECIEDELVLNMRPEDVFSAAHERGNTRCAYLARLMHGWAISNYWRQIMLHRFISAEGIYVTVSLGAQQVLTPAFETDEFHLCAPDFSASASGIPMMWCDPQEGQFVEIQQLYFGHPSSKTPPVGRSDRGCWSFVLGPLASWVLVDDE